MVVVRSDLEKYQPARGIDARTFNDESGETGRPSPKDLRRYSDGDLARLAATGHQAAWRELVNRFTKLVHGSARRAGLSEIDALDVAQLTWLNLWSSLQLGQIRDLDRIAGWLATTARREGIRHSIRRSREVLFADPTLGFQAERDADPGADYGLLRRESYSALQSALEQLPGPYLRLLRLLMSDAHLSYAEVALTLGVPIGSVGPSRLRSLQILRRTPEFAGMPRSRAKRPAAA